MSMFFRNLTLFRFSPAVAADLKRLDEALAEHSLRPCGPLEMFTKGFVPPVGRSEDAPLTQHAGACIGLAVGGQHKLLPAAVGDVTTLATRRANALAWFGKVGGEDDIGIEHLETLVGIKTAIRRGDITPESAFTAPHDPRGTASAPVGDLAAKLAERSAGAPAGEA